MWKRVWKLENRAAQSHQEFPGVPPPPHPSPFSLMWPAALQTYWNNRKRFNGGLQLPRVCLQTRTWPPFNCFRTPIWRMWRHVKHSIWQSHSLVKEEALRESRQVFELAESQIPGLVNLVFYLQTAFTSARILLLINQWSWLSPLYNCIQAT